MASNPTLAGTEGMLFEYGSGTKYDVSQALSFVATSRNDADERLGRQADIPVLLRQLPSRSARRPEA